MPKLIIKLENLSLIIIGCTLYWVLSDSDIFLNFDRWYLIVLVWLSIDLSMVGYNYDKKIGALTYNLIHNYVLAFAAILVGFLINNLDLVAVGTILMIHVGIDRLLGFGVKYPTSFKDTHIQKL